MDRPTLVHVGDKIGEWVVKAIERGKVTLVNASGGARRRHRAEARNPDMSIVERVLIACIIAGAATAPARVALAQRGGAGGQKPPTRQPAEAGHDEEGGAASRSTFRIRI